MKMAIIADKYLATSFGFIGIQAFPVQNTEEAASVLSELISEEEYGVIFISEGLATELKEKQIKIEDTDLPLVFAIIPDFSGPLGNRMMELRELISEAVGAKLKVGG